jgi:hypothetical protein
MPSMCVASCISLWRTADPQQWYGRRVIAVFYRFFNGAVGARAQHLVVSAPGVVDSRKLGRGPRAPVGNADMRKLDSLVGRRKWHREFSETRTLDSSSRDFWHFWQAPYVSRGLSREAGRVLPAESRRPRSLSEVRICGNSIRSRPGGRATPSRIPGNSAARRRNSANCANSATAFVG